MSSSTLIAKHAINVATSQLLYLVTLSSVKTWNLAHTVLPDTTAPRPCKVNYSR